MLFLIEVLSNLERSDATRSLFLPNSAKGFYRLPLWVVELPILKNFVTPNPGKLTPQPHKEITASCNFEN